MDLSKIKSISSDTRKIKQGDVFVAIRGSQSDGHDFIEQAFQNGALYCLVEKSHPRSSELLKNRNVIAVENTRKEYALISKQLHKNISDRFQLCAVTGTNGKTTSTYLMESLLNKANFEPAVLGTVENRFKTNVLESTHTTPDAFELHSLFKKFYDLGARAISMEVSSHALDQERTAGLKFKTALFTNLTQDHLDYHGSMEDYFKAKSKLFLEYDVETRIINSDDAFGLRLLNECEKRNLPTITYGTGNQNISIDFDRIKLDSDGIHGELNCNLAGKTFSVQLESKLLGRFNVYNLAGVVGVGFALGISPELISSSLNHAQQVPGRMERVENKKSVTILVDYAHTPDALENALKTLRPLVKGQLICVFGCGGDRDNKKRPLMGKTALENSDFVFITSDNPRTENPGKIISEILTGVPNNKKNYKVIEDRKSAIEAAIKSSSPGDMVLIAGKGHETYQIIGTQKNHFDDREVVRNFS